MDTDPQQQMMVPLKSDPSETTNRVSVDVDPALQIFPTVSDPTDQIQQDLKLSDGDDNPSKRHATKGQWQTPPIGPFFPSSSNTTSTSASATNPTSTSTATAPAPQPQQPSSSATAGVPPISLQTLPVPNSSDDYAKALQEAYRRGAEAAALMSRSRPPPPPVAAPAGAVAPSPAPSNTTTIGSTTFAFHPMTVAPAPTGTNAALTDVNVQAQVQQQTQVQQQAQQQAQAQSVANPLMPIMTTSQPLPTVVHTHTHPTQQPQQQPPQPGQPQPMMQPQGQPQVQVQQPQPQPQVAATTNYGVPTPLPFYNPTAHASARPTPVTSAPTMATTVQQPQQQQQQVLQQQQQQQQVSQQQVVVHPPPQHVATVVPAPVTSNGRSVSMPDMTAYAAKANDEESKRLKRLARNRASARLRRLRKKNLVESYEGEVGVLETSLAKLRAHRWGVGTDPEALLEALSMDRGQQTITPLQRKELIQNLLKQQQEQVRNVLECQLETLTLGWIARQGEDVTAAGGESGMSQVGVGGEEKEMDLLAAELNGVLQLTPDQKKQLQTATEGMEEEHRAVKVVDTSLSALMSNEWLMNTGIQECTNQFTGILNPTQLSKFLLWSDANSESIDQLDYVNAPPANSQPCSAPTFVFGMEEGHHGDDS